MLNALVLKLSAEQSSGPQDSTLRAAFTGAVHVLSDLIFISPYIFSF